MKKLFLAFFLLTGFFTQADAAPGDTTWVQAHYDEHLSWYGDYDTTVNFPAGSVTYRKIYMIFTLGKYSCPGYDPNNPGDQPGQSGWCGDWDYTVQNFLMTPNGDTLELGRLITPYARETWPRTPLSWKERYIFDVTDFYPLLQNNAALRIHYSGYSGGFTADIKFAFIEGTPERDVLGIDRLWAGNFNYGHGATPINTALSTITKTPPSGTQATELKMNITGHGGDDNACAEFCPNRYTLSLNGSSFVQQDFFRTDCDENDLYPQSGTWVYARANWCPGALVDPFNYTLSGATSGSYSVGMSFPAYTSLATQNNTKASYTIQSAAIYYGAMNKTLDASLEDIIAPTDAEYHYRKNPTARSPIVLVRNTGATQINSIKFSYGVTGMTTQTYTWTAGNFNSLQNIEIEFPPLADLKLSPGTYEFHVKIDEVNSQADDDALNNELKSQFKPAPVFPQDLVIRLTANAESFPGNAAISQTSWHIEDAGGNIVAQKNDCPVSSICTDTVHLNFGEAYRLVVEDSALLGFYDITQGNVAGVWQGTGLSSFSPTSGMFRVYKLGNIIPLGIPMYFSGNFGGGFKMDFFTGFATQVSDINNETALFEVFPNPANDKLHISVTGLSQPEGTVRLVDMLGREVMQISYNGIGTELKTAQLPNGIYQLIYTHANNNIRLQEKVVIAH